MVGKCGKVPYGCVRCRVQGSKKDDAPTGGPLNPAFDYVWSAVVGDVQQALLEGGGADLAGRWWCRR